MSVAEIEAEIKSLEQGDTNWQNIQRLAWLYTVHDHMISHDNTVVSRVRDVMPEFNDSEFGKVIAGKDISKIADVLSEHMDIVKVLHPKEYSAVCKRIEKCI